MLALKADGKGSVYGEVELTTKVINTTRIIWNFQKLPGMSGKCWGILFWWLGGNPVKWTCCELWQIYG